MVRVVLTVVLILVFNTITFAGVTFTDIQNSIFKQDIERLYSLNIVKGYDNKFYPSNKISGNELAIMILNSFYRDKTYKTTENYLSILKENNLVTDVEINWLNNNQINNVLVWKIILATQGIYSYKTNWYTEVSNLAIQVGLTDTLDNMYNEPTRDEVVHYIAFTLENKQKFDTLINNLAVNININNNTNNKRIEYIVKDLINNIPKHITDKFISNDWSIEIVDDVSAIYTEYPDAIGMCDSGIKKLYIESLAFNNGNTVFHEFGHAIYYIIADELNSVNFNKFSSILYANEAEKAIELKREYTGTNDKECFADLFSYLLANKDNTKNIELARELCPSYTRLILDGIINNKDSLIDTNILKELCTEYGVDTYGI